MTSVLETWFSCVSEVVMIRFGLNYSHLEFAHDGIKTQSYS